MLFARSYMLMLIGLILLVMCAMLGFILPFIIIIMFVFIGALLIIVSFVFIHLRAINSTLSYLLEDPKRNEVRWLYVYGDYDIRVTPAMRQLEKHSFSKIMDQQIQDFKTYNFAGHKIRIVPEGIGHSVDLGKCLYSSHAKRAWNVKSLNELRRWIVKDKDKSEEKANTLEAYQKARGVKHEEK